MIDTHCHLEIEDLPSLEKELDTIKEAGVESMIVSCCTKEEQLANLSYLKEKESVYLALGYHPEEAGKIDAKDILSLKECLTTISNVVAVGEIGLDYYYTKENQKEQQILFESQLKLAEQLHLPVVIHSRDATKETIEILKKYKVKGVIHCFSGSLETAMIYIKMGYKLGIGGVVTFKNSHLGEVVKHIPLSSILLETDSPYLSPVPYRGEKNSPKRIPIIASKIADLKGISLEEVEKITTENAREVFDLSSKTMV